jgi:hypothetical protein
MILFLVLFRGGAVECEDYAVIRPIEKKPHPFSGLTVIPCDGRGDGYVSWLLSTMRGNGYGDGSKLK